MNKQVFVFILLFIALSNAQYVFNPNCDVNVTGCAELKASCTGPVNMTQVCYNSGNGVINGSCCAEGLWCVSGTCQRDNYGSACTNTNYQTNCLPDQDGTMATGCNNGQCTELYGAGDTCTNSSTCIGNLTCSNTTNTCSGLALGSVCNIMWSSFLLSDCAAPNYCGFNGTKYVCTAPAASGGGCNSTVACNQVNVCSKGSCVAIGSVASGGAASNPYACENGLIFNGTNCLTSLGDALVSCTENSDCKPYNFNISLGGNLTFTVTSNCTCFPQSGNSYCMVNSSYGPGVPSTQLNTLASCLQTNNCSYNGYQAANSGNPVYNANSAPDSCSYVNCWSAYKKFAGQSCSDSDDMFGSCFYSPECGGFPVWAIVVIVIVAVILVLAVVVVIFLVLRRRKDYASI